MNGVFATKHGHWLGTEVSWYFTGPHADCRHSLSLYYRLVQPEEDSKLSPCVIGELTEDYVWDIVTCWHAAHLLQHLYRDPGINKGFAESAMVVTAWESDETKDIFEDESRPAYPGDVGILEGLPISNSPALFPHGHVSTRHWLHCG